MSRLLDDPNLVVQTLIAIATFAAVGVALFLKEIRARWRPPILNVELSNKSGHLAEVHVRRPGEALPVTVHVTQARYYHLMVSNPRRKIDAVNNVFMSLLKIERKAGDGLYHEMWSGDIPFQWRNELEARKVIGTWCEADLCHVLEGKWLQLAVEKVVPHNLEKVYRVSGPDATTLPIDLAVTVQARGNEVDSEVQRWRIYWDGKWEDGEVEMRKHFHVTRLQVRQ